MDVPAFGSSKSLLDTKGRVSSESNDFLLTLITYMSRKPLRPFTILSQGSSSRTRIQAGVFQPDHRLPTMTIDEYLEEEKRRGNIITGGGYVDVWSLPSLL